MGINEVKIAIAAIKAAPDNKKAIDTLEKILKNILTHPSEAKYRKLKVAGKVFTETLLPVDGACDFLYSLGFTESEDGAWLQVDQLNSDTKTMFVHAVFLLKTNQSGSSSAPLQGKFNQSTKISASFSKLQQNLQHNEHLLLLLNLCQLLLIEIFINSMALFSTFKNEFSVFAAVL